MKDTEERLRGIMAAMKAPSVLWELLAEVLGENNTMRHVLEKYARDDHDRFATEIPFEQCNNYACVKMRKLLGIDTVKTDTEPTGKWVLLPGFPQVEYNTRFNPPVLRRLDGKSISDTDRQHLFAAILKSQLSEVGDVH